MEQAETLIPVEIKSGQTIASDFFDGLQKFQALAGSEATTGYLLYGGTASQKRGVAEVVAWLHIKRMAQLCIQ